MKKLVTLFFALSLLGFISAVFADEPEPESPVVSADSAIPEEALEEVSPRVSLLTATENMLSLSLSDYQYREPSLNVKMDAKNLGVTYRGTVAFTNNYFVMGQIDYRNGDVDYEGTGVQSNVPQYYTNIKLSGGHDFDFGRYVLSPYIGIGYRHLTQRWGGTHTSTGNFGYDRISTYRYIPIGLIHRFSVGSEVIVETALEYDYMFSGNQFSGLSVANKLFANTDVPDVNNHQDRGNGLDLSITLRNSSWGIGGYYKYWSIVRSETKYGTIKFQGNHVAADWYEPSNHTQEFGLMLNYYF